MTRPLRTLLAAAASLTAVAQASLDAPAVRNWAWDQAKTWSVPQRDAQGRPLWNKPVPFLLAGYEVQTGILLDHLAGSDPQKRRAALVVLGTRPLEHWGPQALRRDACRDEAAVYLYRRGFRLPDADPFRYLGPSAAIERPWTQGLGIHLEGAGWRFQWIPSPAVLPAKAGGGLLPPALDRAPAPTALLRLARLRPGLQRLRTLAGGSEGIPAALAHGTRAGFMLRHLGPWLDKGGLEALADREAWVLHYGLTRGFAPSAGTLVFLPGDLPTRTSLALALLKLNPTSLGARSRTQTWEDGRGGKAQVTQVRGSGGVLHLLAAPGGTWICDREAPLRAVAFPSPLPSLGERREWCGVALAGARPGTEVSLWVLPRIGGGPAFERAILRRRLQGADQATWANPGIAKAAPRAGVFSAAFGAGPTEVFLQSLLAFDRDGLPALAPLPQGPLAPNPEQRRAWERERDALARRRQERGAIQEEVSALLAHLDLRGAALLWNGWTAPEPLTRDQRNLLADLQRLRKADPRKAANLVAKRSVDVYGGFLEPGLAPGLALGLPVKAGHAAQAREAVARLWPRLFKGRVQARELAQGVSLHRMVTDQAFRPSYALAGDVLVLATDDAAAQTMVAGVLGQAPTLADSPSRAFGRVELDGARAAQDLEALLLSYLRANQGGRYWWMGEPAPTGDEAAAEVASTFGPFLAAVKALGRREVQVELTPAGFEASCPGGPSR